MNSIFSIRRSVSRIVAGAFFAALFALGSVPALAFTVTKAGSGEGGVPVFTITLDNTQGALDANSPQVLDPLPGIGTIDWSLNQEAVDWGCTIRPGSYFDPDPNNSPPDSPYPANQQVIDCDGTTVDAGNSFTIVATGTVIEDPCSLALVNTVYVEAGNYPATSATGTIDGSGSGCRMTGGGSIFFTNDSGKKIRVTHGFEIRCDADDPRQNIEINWPGNNKNQNNFHLTDMDTAGCTDDPAVEQKPPRAPFDTYVGTGVGTCNGQEAWIDFVFVDGGEPGTKDYAVYKISGACSLEAEGYITKGNQQAHN